MSIRINAHQLGRLIDQTRRHIAPTYNEQYYGIRLEADTRYLYAVGTDAFTIAVSRYALSDSPDEQEPFARTIPGKYVKSLREWVDTLGGACWVTVTTAEDRLVLEGPQSRLTLGVVAGLEFVDWRAALRKIVNQTVDADLFPALNSEMMARFGETGHILRVRVTADEKPVLFIGEDFIGAQMPVRVTKQTPIEHQSFADARTSWWWTLAAGGDDVDLADIPTPERPRFEASTDVQETAEGLLRGVMRSTSSAFDVAHFDEDRDAFHAHIHAGVADWMAYRYLDALHRVDPRAAQAVVTDTADELDSGELGEFAWDAAKSAGHDPQKWQDDYEAALNKRYAEEPALWARRLAAALNAASSADIGFTVADNPHVRFDEGEDQWVAVKPEPAAAPAT
ncbi:MAG: hypothetical protein HOY76_51505 [Streptomyces sp.]|nr:hypothetical protein [Streptomyces sp.]